MKRFLILVLCLTPIVIATVLGAYNDTPVNVNILVAQISTSLAYVIAVSVLTGFFLAWLLCLLPHFKLKLQLAQLQRQVSKQSQADKSATQLQTQKVDA